MEMFPNVSNTDEASLGIAIGFELIDGNSLAIKDGTPDTEGASLVIVLGFALIDGNSLGDREGTPDTEGASLGWGRCPLCMEMVCKGKEDERRIYQQMLYDHMSKTYLQQVVVS